MQAEIICLFEVSDDRIEQAVKKVFPDGSRDQDRERRCMKKAMADIVEMVLKNHFKDDSEVDLTFVTSDATSTDVEVEGQPTIHKIGNDKVPVTQKDVKDTIDKLRKP